MLDTDLALKGNEFSFSEAQFISAVHHHDALYHNLVPILLIFLGIRLLAFAPTFFNPRISVWDYYVMSCSDVMLTSRKIFLRWATV